MRHNFVNSTIGVLIAYHLLVSKISMQDRMSHFFLVRDYVSLPQKYDPVVLLIVLDLKYQLWVHKWHMLNIEFVFLEQLLYHTKTNLSQGDGILSIQDVNLICSLHTRRDNKVEIVMTQHPRQPVTNWFDCISSEIVMHVQWNLL